MSSIWRSAKPCSIVAGIGSGRICTPMNVRDRAIKLLARELRGSTPGEREAARHLLDKHCERHGLDREDLKRGERDLPVELTHRNACEADLLIYLAAEIARTWEVGFRAGKRRYVFMLTQLEGAELRTAYGALRTAMAREAHAAQVGFIIQNVHAPHRDTPKDAPTCDRDMLERIKRMRDHAPVVQRHKQLEAGTR